ncbi:hypothetical protein Tco_0361016 [Tanacetum coccineum]
MESTLCPLCSSAEEDIQHLLFGCNMAVDIFRRLCRWWKLDWQSVGSFLDGIRGSLRSIFRPKLKLYWKEFLL